jgi:hypothetical protein
MSRRNYARATDGRSRLLGPNGARISPPLPRGNLGRGGNDWLVVAERFAVRVDEAGCGTGRD